MTYPTQRFLPALLAAALAIPLPGFAMAASLLVASASNFKPALVELAPDFTALHGHEVTVSSASSGTLYAQISHGAPFDILLAADSAYPRKLEQAGYTVAGSRFTYASGVLVLVYHDKLRALAEAGPAAILAAPNLTLAIANPAVAPYGAAAAQVLRRFPRQHARLLRATNIMQAYQMWHSGGADAALVARSQVREGYLTIPAHWYTALQQQAVILKTAAHKQAARDFMAYLKSARARLMIESFGYRVTEHDDG